MTAAIAERTELKHVLCEQWCSGATVRDAHGMTQISLPSLLRDGDQVSVWIRPIAGGWRVSDAGLTLMRLSYDVDVGQVMSGGRRKVFDAVLADTDVTNDDGELVREVPEGQLGTAIMRLGQAIARILDLSLWTRARVENTFQDDLRALIVSIAGEDRVQADYVPDNVPMADDYPVDLRIQTGGKPLYVFGVGSKDKARLTTISLQHYLQSRANFESLVVFADSRALPASDARRLLNVSDTIIDSLEATDDLRRKLESRLS